MSAATAGSGVIRGRVTSGSGDPVEGAAVMIGGNSPSHVDIAALTSPAGEYELVGLVPGEYEILANAGTEVLVRHVDVAAGEVAELHFVANDR